MTARAKRTFSMISSAQFSPDKTSTTCLRCCRCQPSPLDAGDSGQQRRSIQAPQEPEPPRKAAGPRGIPCCLLQMVTEELAPAITHLFNKALITSQIPAIWKHALVKPVFKKGDCSQGTYCRPISLTCICCKLLEYVVRAEVTHLLEQHRIIMDAQVDDLASELDKGGQTDTILLDFSKAFDKVPQEFPIKINACS